MRRILLVLAISVAGWSQPAPQQAQPPMVVKVVEVPPAPPRDILGYFQALGPLIAACAAVIVGRTQYVVQRRAQKQQLFEKCFTVYKAADAFVSDTISRNCKPDRDSYHTFQHTTDPAQFLFGSDVLEVLQWIKDVTGRLATESDVPVDRVNEQTESQRWVSQTVRGAAFSIQWDERKVVFWSYLQLHEDRRWYTRLEDYFQRAIEAELVERLAGGRRRARQKRKNC